MTEQIVSYLNSQLDNYLRDLRTVVGIDSGSENQDGVNAVNGWLEIRLIQLGCNVERYPQAQRGDNLLATLRGRGKGRILLMGHTDTVYPVGTVEQRPMTVDHERDRVLGPGVCDMKAGLVSGIYAMEALRKVSFDSFDTIYYLAVSDEETDRRHSPPQTRSVSHQCDVVLTLESARENGDIVTARKAIAWYTIEAFGKAAHAGVEPEKGNSAILALAQLTVLLHRLNGIRPGVTVNVGSFAGGSLPSIVPDYAKCRVDVRAWSQADMQAFLDALKAQLNDLPHLGVKFVVTLEAGSAAPAMERTPAVIKLEEMAQAAARELGFEVKGATTGGSSDVCFAADEGIPALDGLGPVGGLDHGPDEYILLSSIVPRVALLAKLIMAIGQQT